MSRLGFLCAVFLVAASCIAPSNLRAAEVSHTGKHFLWRVSNATAPFYLLGSMHALRAKDYPLGPEIDLAIRESKRFLYEHDIEHPDPDLSSKEMRDVAHFPTGVTVQQKIKPDMKPWAIAYFMLENPGMRSFNEHLSVERYVYQK